MTTPLIVSILTIIIKSYKGGSMKVLIIGGVAGGASAAARLRRINEECEIILFERGRYVSFANCGLPYHIGDVIKDRDKLLVQTVEKMQERFKIDVRVRTEVVSLDSEKKEVRVRNLETNEEYTETYDKLLLSPGAEPARPNIENIKDKKVFTLRNMKDMDNIISYIKENNVKTASIVGGGFIGIEVAENLHERGIDSSIIEFGDQVLGIVDREFANMVHENIVDNGVGLYLKYQGLKITDKGILVKDRKEGLEKEIESDLIILATGVVPETSLAKSGNLEFDERLGIKVNKKLETSVKDVYAVGDAISVNHLISGKEVNIPLAWPANRQGRLVADVINGKDVGYNGTLGTSILKAFDLQLSATGLTEAALNKNGLEYRKDYLVAIVDRNSNAGYYPGATPLTLKLIFSLDGTILGAQGIGVKGVDKRIDVIATAIKGKIKAQDLQDLELAYAPPFNSAKDPINILGYYAENILEGEIKQVRGWELDQLIKDDSYALLDVRSKEENEIKAIDNSININLEDLRNNLDKLDKEKTYIIYCAVGLRGYIGYKILINNGFKAVNLDGGYKIYSSLNYKVETPTSSNNGDRCGVMEDLLKGEKMEETMGKIIDVDACGLQCPGPLLETSKAMAKMEVGDTLRIKSTDLGFKKDVATWTEKTNNQLLDLKMDSGIIEASIKKGNSKGAKTESVEVAEKNRQTIVAFSGDLDKMIATMIIANGAQAMGKEVSIFFTFWGLNALRKENFKPKNKGFMDKMFGAMMPKGTKKLKLSNMNMMGMGTAMMKGVMNKKNVSTLEELFDTFIKNGGRLIACQMTVDMLGFEEGELIDAAEFGGVGTFLGDSMDSYSTLFI